MGVKKLLVFICFFSCILNVWSFQDKRYFLIDSINYAILPRVEKQVLDSLLNNYHRAKALSGRIETLEHIVKNLKDDHIRNKYNYLLVQQIDSALKVIKGENIVTDKIKSSKAFTMIYRGEINQRNGDIPKALDFYNQALELYRKLKNRKGEAVALNKIGSVFSLQDQTNRSINYHQQALSIQMEIEDHEGVAYALNHLAYNYKKQRKLKKSIEYFKASLKLFKKYKNQREIAKTYNSIGQIYERQNKFDIALDYYFKSLKLREEYGSKADITYSFINIGYIYHKLKNTRQAKEAALNAYSLATDLGYPRWIKDASLLANKVHIAEGDWQSAYKYFSTFVRMKDSIKNKAIQQTLAQYQIQFENEKHETEMKKINDKLLIADIQRKKDLFTKKMLLVAGLVLLIVIGIIIYGLFKINNANSALKNQSKEILEKNVIIDKSLTEKELLLKEIHHRVKNNLQLISSLLNLQISALTSPDAIEALEESKNRVLAIALIHKKLYQDTSFRLVNIKAYIEELLESQRNLMREPEIKMDTAIDDLFLGIDTAIPLGLLISEFISNSLKHAFNDPSITDPTIFISIREINESKYELIFKDNGKGLKKGTNMEESNSLGFDLISAFIDQIQGEMEMSSSLTGLNYVVNFIKE